jgi:site-specific recombinase XerD
VVSKMLGHKNVKQTQHYAKMSNTRIQDEMMGLKSLYA